MNRLLLISLLYGLVSSTQLVAQQPAQPVSQAQPRIRFEHLTVADGLPENSVMCMIQDRRGFMWLGTQNGLVRYDGTNMTVFQYDPRKPYSLKGRMIKSLYEDRNGDIWVGCTSLFRYERATGRFIEYPRKSPEPTEESDNIFSIQEDKKGNIWTVTARGKIRIFALDRYSLATNTWTYFRHNPNDSRSLTNSSVAYAFANQNSLPAFGMSTDKDGTLWVITRGESASTLHRFDPKIDRFVTVRPHTNPALAADFKAIRSVTPDNQGNLYLGSRNKGLFRFNPKTGQLTQFKHDPANPASLEDDRVGQVYPGRGGLIWVPTEKAMNRLNPQTGVFTRFLANPNDPVSSAPGSQRVLHEMPNGDSWFAAETGLVFYHKQSNTFTRYGNSTSESDSLQYGNGINSFLVDRTGLVWVGSWGAGLNKQSRVVQLPRLALFPNNPTGFAITCVFESPSQPDVLWYGHTHGLTKFDKKTGRYTHYRTDSLNVHSITKGRVAEIAEDKQGRLWVATWGGGLNLMDRPRGTFTRYEPNIANANSLIGSQVSSHITALLPAADGTLWIGAYEGLDQFDPVRQAFTHHYLTDTLYTTALYDRILPLTVPARRVAAILHPVDKADKTTAFALTNTTDLLVVTGGEMETAGRYDYGWIEDAQGHIVWENQLTNSASDGHLTMRAQVAAIHLRAGQYRLRYKSNERYSYGSWLWGPPYHPELWGIQLLRVTPAEARDVAQLARKRQVKGLLDVNMRVLREDAQHRIWTGSNYGGVHIFDPATGTSKTFFNNLQGPSCVLAILPDTRPDRFWVGNYAFGLFLMDTTGRILKRYNAANGLGSNYVSEIQRDANGYLWLSTDNGLVRFAPIDGPPRTEQFRHFTKRNGLPALFLPYSAKTRDGRLYFMSLKGGIAFDPSQIKDDSFVPPVVLTDIAINGQSATLGEGGQLPEHIAIAKGITLPYDQNDLTFHFAALSYNRGSENQYAFKLAPNDQDWLFVGSTQQARFLDLRPGEYTFSVKAANADGVWNEKGTSVKVTIRSPWWSTWWAYLLYALAFGVLLRAYIVYRSRVLRRENQLLEEKVTQRTNEVQEQKEEIEVQRDHLEQTLTELQTTQAQLIQKEKLASLGELTAGIAHEIQNPLNFVNNFSEVSSELVSELREEEAKPDRDQELITDLFKDLSSNLQKINHHGGRASSIVKGMLEHSRSSSGEKQPTNLNALADEYLKIAYHGLRAKDKDFNCELMTDFDATVGKLDLIPQDMGRVLLNLYNNTFYAVAERVRQSDEAGYQPIIIVNTQRQKDQVMIRVRDNGTGIPESVKAKIFQPFFTTKPTGEGTGLGLSLSYDIITKGHGGTLNVMSTEGEGTEFIIILPITL